MRRPGTFQPFDDADERSSEDQRRGRENRILAFREMVRAAAANRHLTASDTARWHRELFEGLSIVPDPCYLGGYRGSSHPWLMEYIVTVGMHDTVPPNQVSQELERFFATLAVRSAALARHVAPEQRKSWAEVERVASLAAWAHGEWVRIHPFTNGNGRVARLLANYVLARFHITPAVRLKPRPGLDYEAAARASMRGDHTRMTKWIINLLRNSGR